MIIEKNNYSISSRLKSQDLEFIKQIYVNNADKHQDYYNFGIMHNGLAGADKAIAAISNIMMNVKIDDVGSGLSAATGNGDDKPSLKTNGYVAGIDSGSGDDTINIWAEGYMEFRAQGDNEPHMGVTNVHDRAGNDHIAITSKATASGTDGGSGDDLIKVSAKTVNGLEGGKGNDAMIIDSQSGKASSLILAQGDGQDYVEANSELNISLDKVDHSTVKLAKTDNDTYLFKYGTQGDTVTIKLTGGMTGKDIQLVINKSGMIKLELVDQEDPLNLVMQPDPTF